MNKPERDYKVICDEITKLLALRDYTFFELGKCLYELRGSKTKHGGIWKQDPRSKGIRNFTDYCTKVWEYQLDRRSIFQYIKDYEVYKDIQDDKEMPSTECAMRPLTTLKKLEDQKNALEFARAYQNREGAERLTARHTASGVRAVRGLKEAHVADRKRIGREVERKISEETQLACYTVHGIGYLDVMNEFKGHWNSLLKTLKPMSGLTDEELTKTVAKWVLEFLNALLR